MENGTEYVWREFGDNRAKAIGKDQFGGINTIGYGTGSGTQSSETPIINNSGIVQNYNFGNNQKGRYAFKSFVPGNYIVRFIYGDTVETALVNPNSGINDDNTNNSKEISKVKISIITGNGIFCLGLKIENNNSAFLLCFPDGEGIL